MKKPVFILLLLIITAACAALVVFFSQSIGGNTVLTNTQNANTSIVNVNAATKLNGNISTEFKKVTIAGILLDWNVITPPSNSSDLPSTHSFTIKADDDSAVTVRYLTGGYQPTSAFQYRLQLPQTITAGNVVHVHGTLSTSQNGDRTIDVREQDDYLEIIEK